jgi:tRNA-binding EMAP/Myf-like protein
MSGKNLSEKIAFEDFDKVDIRAGKIIEVEDFPRARNRRKKLEPPGENRLYKR